MKEYRRIIDTTLRDGEQSPGIALGMDDKIKIAKMLDNIGVYEIEAGIPCLGGNEAEIIREIVNKTKNAKISVWKAHTDIEIEMHVHNDLGMAVANSITGAKAGAEYIDCTLFGIGERTGNCNFYDFIHASESIFQFAMTKNQIKEVEREAYELLKGAL